MDFVLPPLLWLGVGKRSLGWRILNWTIVVGYRRHCHCWCAHSF